MITVTHKTARISHEGRVVLLAFLAGLPGSAAALWMLWAGPGPAPTRLARMRTTTRVLRARRGAPERQPSSWWSA